MKKIILFLFLQLTAFFLLAQRDSTLNGYSDENNIFQNYPVFKLNKVKNSTKGNGALSLTKLGNRFLKDRIRFDSIRWEKEANILKPNVYQLDNLLPGMYCVTVFYSDAAAACCQSSDCIEIYDCDSIPLYDNLSLPCSKSDFGKFSMSIEDSNSDDKSSSMSAIYPVQMIWNDGSTLTERTDLKANSKYSFKLIDGAGCVFMREFDVKPRFEIKEKVKHTKGNKDNGEIELIIKVNFSPDEKPEEPEYYIEWGDLSGEEDYNPRETKRKNLQKGVYEYRIACGEGSGIIGNIEIK